MSPTLVAILMIALVIGSLFVKRVPMQYALYIVPVFCALLLGYNFTEIGDMFIKQVNTAMQAAGYCNKAAVIQTVSNIAILVLAILVGAIR